MRSGGGKSKGSSFEREIAEELSLWISNRERKDLFRRTVLSGGQFTHGKGLRGEPGDLGPNHEVAFPFTNKWVTECKSWADLGFKDFIWGEGLLYEAWQKVKAEATICAKAPMLIAKQNRWRVMIFIPVSESSQLGLVPNLDYHLLHNGTVYMTRFFDMTKLAHPGQLVQAYAPL